MKKDEVKVGGIYTAKVSDKVVPVRIDAEHPSGGGWDATNLSTNKKVRIKSAQRLRGEAKRTAAVKAAIAKADGAPGGAPGGGDVAASAKTAAKATKRATPATDAAGANDGETGAKAKGGKKKAAPKEKKPKKMSLIDAAVQVLGESKEAMNCKQMVEQVTAKGLWSTNAPTPHATLYSAILREIQNKGDEARFVKVERGRFALAG